MNNILFSSKSDNWKTPTNIYNFFINNGFYDPCPFNSNFNGLTISWNNKNFVNPPYSDISNWVDKCILEHSFNKIVFLLIPARTDTKYFNKLVNYGCNIYFFIGRLKFNNLGSAPFPSCLIELKGDHHVNCKWISNKLNFNLDNFL